MKPINFSEYNVTINGITTKVHFAEIQKDTFLTLFTQQPKDFINGFNAKGMITVITQLGDVELSHSAIKIKKESSLTDDVMDNLWKQIVENIG